MQAYLFHDPRARSSATRPRARRSTRPGGRLLEAGDTIRLPELGDLLERLGAEGPGFLYEGDVAAAVSDWVLERGGLLTREDLAAYEVVEREPARATYRGREVLTNPPPSSGGILIAYSLDLLERLDRPRDLRALVEVMDRDQPRAQRGLPRGARHARATSSASWPRTRSTRWPPRCARGSARPRTSR